MIADVSFAIAIPFLFWLVSHPATIAGPQACQLIGYTVSKFSLSNYILKELPILYQNYSILYIFVKFI